MRHAFTTRNVHVPDESVHIGARRRAVLAARRHCGGSCRCRCPRHRAASTARLQDRVRAALRVLERAFSRRRSARCSTASPTPSSTRSCAAPSRSMDRAEATAPRRRSARRGRLQPRRRPRVRDARSSCRRRRPRSTRSAPAACSSAIPSSALGEPLIGIWGRRLRARDALLRRRRPGRDLPAADDGSERGAAAARQERCATAGAALTARYLQSVAITVLGRGASRRRAACRRGTRARRSWRWCARGGCRSSSVVICARGAAAVVGLRRRDRGPARPWSWPPLRLPPSCASPRAPGRPAARRARPPRGHRRRGRPLRPARRWSARAAGASMRSGGARMSPLGRSRRRRQVAVLDVAALVAPLPLRRRRAGRSGSPRRAASRATSESGHGLEAPREELAGSVAAALARRRNRACANRYFAPASV